MSSARPAASPISKIHWVEVRRKIPVRPLRSKVRKGCPRDTTRHRRASSPTCCDGIHTRCSPSARAVVRAREFAKSFACPYVRAARSLPQGAANSSSAVGIAMPSLAVIAAVALSLLTPSRNLSRWRSAMVVGMPPLGNPRFLSFTAATGNARKCINGPTATKQANHTRHIRMLGSVDAQQRNQYRQGHKKPGEQPAPLRS